MRHTAATDMIEELLSHAGWTRSLAFRLVRDADEAEDLVQEAWLAALRAPPAPGAPRAWIATVVRNLVRDGVRTRRRGLAREAEVEGARDAVPTAEALLAEAEAHRNLSTLVLGLREPYRATVLLRYFEGKSSADIARAHGIPEGTVRWRLKTALDELRQSLDAQTAGDRERWRRALAPLLPAGAAPLTGTRSAPATPVRAPVLPLAIGLPAAGLAALVSLIVAYGSCDRVPRQDGTVAAAPSAPQVAVPAIGFPLVDVQPGTVYADVVSADGQPLTDAAVVVGAADDRSGRVLGTSRTGADGRARVGPLPAGDYLVSASAADHVASSLRVSVRGGDPAGVRLALAPGGAELAGAVVDSSGGAIPGALVELRYLNTGGKVRLANELSRTVTDADGRFSIRAEPGSYRLRADADGYASKTGSLTLLGDESREIALTAAARVAGVVRDARTGEAVAGATVTGETLGGAEWGHLSATSDDEGRFVLDDIPPGRFHLTGRKGELSTEAPTPVSVEIAQRLEGVELRIGAARRIVGRVLDPQGRPVAKALVWYDRGRRPNPDRSYPPEQGTTADEQGRFALTGVPVGPVVLRAEGDACAPADPIVVDGDVQQIDVHLRPGLRLAGVVLLPDGTPAERAGVEIAVRSDAGPRAPVMARDFVTTGRGGTFASTRLPPGAATVTATHPEHGVARTSATVGGTGGGDGVTLRFEKTASVEGRVLWEDGTPAAQAHVRWRPGTRVGERDVPEAIVDATGRFELPRVSSGGGVLTAFWPTVADSFTEVRSESDTRRRTDRVTLVLAAGRKLEGVQLKLARPDRTIEGTVLGPDGKAVDGAVIDVQPDSSSDDFVSILPQRRSTSAPDGRFAVTGLPRGTYVLRASHPGLPDLEVPGVRAGARGVRLRFSRPASISGVVVDEAGSPVPTGTAVVVALPPPGRIVFTFGRAEGARQAVRDGRFEVAGLAAGRFELYVTTLDGRGGLVSPVELRDGEQRRGLRVTVRTAVEARGRVVELGTQRPLSGVSIEVSGSDPHDRVLTAPDGTFALRGLVPGRTVIVRPDDGSPGMSHARVVALPLRGHVDLPPFAIDPTPAPAQALEPGDGR